MNGIDQNELEVHIEESEEGDILVPQDWVQGEWVTDVPNLDDEEQYPDDPESILTYADELEIQRRQRQKFLMKRVGFYGDSLGEVAHGYALASRDWGVGGSAKYLATITQHQANAVRQDGEPIDTDDPEAAARLIAQEFGNYGASARGEVQGLLELRGALARYGELSPETPLVEVVSLREWKQEDWLRRGLIDLFRSKEAEEFVTQVGDDHTGDKYALSDPETQLRLDDFIGSLKLGEAQELISKRSEQQNERLSFWTQQLTHAHGLSTGRLKAVLSKQLGRVGRSQEN